MRLVSVSDSEFSWGEHGEAKIWDISSGRELLKLTAGQATKREVKLQNNGGSPIILTVRASYEAELNEANRAARSDGFSITRSYETLDGDSLDGEPIPLGSLVRVRLAINASQKHNYVAITDKLPAGLEPLNTNLSTTEKVAGVEMTAVIQKSLGLLSHSEMRDSRVAFYDDELPSGAYEYSYVARATTPGTFLRPAADVEAMYLPAVSGATATDDVTIK